MREEWGVAENSILYSFQLFTNQAGQQTATTHMHAKACQ